MQIYIKYQKNIANLYKFLVILFVFTKENKDKLI